jgi:putative hemolysin
MSDIFAQHYLVRPASLTFQSNWLLQRKVGAPYRTTQHGQESTYEVQIADTATAVKEAQRLRYQVFTSEYGAIFKDANGIDEDKFDLFCDHLIVRHRATAEVIGTYRMLLPQKAKRIGRYYCQNEFSIANIQRKIPELAELGRSCVHPDHRNGTVIMLLWSGIFRYMRAHDCNFLIGCASVSMRDGGLQAAALWNQFKANQLLLVDPQLEAFPKNPLDLDSLDRGLPAELPPLIRSYLKIGARVCGEPAWDADFNTADFMMLLDISTMNPRYARHFGMTHKPDSLKNRLSSATVDLV